jgi:hypothetical protein
VIDVATLPAGGLGNVKKIAGSDGGASALLLAADGLADRVLGGD